MQADHVGAPVAVRAAIGHDVEGEVCHMSRRGDDCGNETRHPEGGKPSSDFPDRGRILGEVVAKPAVDLDVDQSGGNYQPIGLDLVAAPTLFDDQAIADVEVPWSQPVACGEKPASDVGHDSFLALEPLSNICSI
jgi:hypothetical protein